MCIVSSEVKPGQEKQGVCLLRGADGGFIFYTCCDDNTPGGEITDRVKSL